jgi:hypothetical protein
MSMGASLTENTRIDEQLANPRQDVYMFRVQGTICLRVDILLPVESRTPRFAQLSLYYYAVCGRMCTHAATYCVIIQTQRTQISGRNSNGTKHSGGLLEDGREKRPKPVGVLYLQTRF